MKKIKLLKSILIPTLGITSIGTIPVVSTSCGEVHVTSVSLNKTSTTLAVGETKALNVTVLPESATDKSVTWSSSNESIVRVDENGNIIAIANGTATITARSVDSPDLIF